MTTYILFSLALSLFFIMPTMTHPLSLGLSILFCSLASCLLVGALSYAWFGFILFLIFVGGLLVMFAYVSALSPNVYFSGKNLTTGFFTLWTITGISFFFLFFSDTVFLSDMLETSFTVSNSSMGENLVIPSRVSIMVGLGIVLLLNLLAVVKICYYQQGPLRQHFM
uniref:NADH dehydrogenase subunit 6 n=1 Tax=Gigantopelta aegis TaxID=1735272 RepID=UPI001EDDFDAA|nr:NADH dehydrogenase subunit 6 [Gigantopelta aegis]UFK31937.1 NADH dehydrogenase subunit 6 [Gigantopelta aegis]UKE79905.1 NADH dehydrogenase subunit 6 [Gigantopelta aegis]